MSAFEGKTKRMKTTFGMTAWLAMLAVMSTSVGIAYAACEPTQGDLSDPSFAPETMKIGLSGSVNDYMEAELIEALDDNLTQFPGLKTIKIDLQSTGGSPYSAYRIHNYLRGLHERNGLQVVVHNVSYVESAAVYIYCGGNQRIVSPYSNFMVHRHSFDVTKEGTIADFQDLSEEFELNQKLGEKLISHCTSLTGDQAADLVLEQTYLDPEQALELGLAHSIIPASYDRQVDIRCQIDGGEQPEQ